MTRLDAAISLLDAMLDHLEKNPDDDSADTAEIIIRATCDRLSLTHKGAEGVRDGLLSRLDRIAPPGPPLMRQQDDIG